MIIFGIIASFAALGALCLVLFNLAVFALPFFAGVSAGMAAFHSGTGPVGAFAIGILTGAATLVAGQFAITLLPSPLLRSGIALLFAAPAAFAGYHASHGIAAMTMPSEALRQAFAILGSLVVGHHRIGAGLAATSPILVQYGAERTIPAGKVKPSARSPRVAHAANPGPGGPVASRCFDLRCGGLTDLT